MIHTFVERASATAAFREALTEFVRTGAPSDRVRFDYRSPPVKVERVLTKLLASCADLPVEAVEIDGSSGCEFYRGEATVMVAGGVARRILFRWDCRWRAMEQGWTDYFGFPDQTRAAREFGYDCFQTWEDVAAGEGAPA
jgi:hypothetical protein